MRGGMRSFDRPQNDLSTRFMASKPLSSTIAYLESS
jgi:hypothetical protein